MIIQIEITGYREKIRPINNLIREFVEDLKRIDIDVAGYTQIPKVKED